MARTVFETASAADVGAVILELARSEQTYTFQRPIDYATAVLAGAIAAGWRGPVFIQGDHYQFNAKKYAADPEAMTEEIRRACRLAIDAGYRNIDIDSSTLVDLSKATVDEQQHENYVRAAELTALIRSLETRRGHDQRRRRDRRGRQGELERGRARRLPRRLPGASSSGARRAPSASARSASRRGRPTAASRCPTAPWPRSSWTSTSSAASARSPERYGLAGAVQHGASTLPDDLFHRFPAVETAEIHLATGFQNALYEHPAFPAELHREIEAWVFENAQDERKPGPDRPAVRLHDPQEGDRAVQARAVGPGDQGPSRRSTVSPRSRPRSRRRPPSVPATRRPTPRSSARPMAMPRSAPTTSGRAPLYLGRRRARPAGRRPGQEHRRRPGPRCRGGGHRHHDRGLAVPGDRDPPAQGRDGRAGSRRPGAGAGGACRSTSWAATRCGRSG